MKTRIQVFQASEGQADPIPDALKRAREYISTTATGDMRIHGIMSVATTYRQIGLCNALDVSFEPFEGEGPCAALTALRNKVVRRTCERLFDYGILALELFPTEEEMQSIRDGWLALETGTGPAATRTEGDGGIQMIDLNIEEDPSGESVVDEDSDDKELSSE